MLKSLELIGFKSFADRTRFDFHSGITAVVGPNGSGKSNVVDAIKWILGDQSAKSLRGKEMTDVIFNGAAGRKPANMAEATLLFDNASRFLPSEKQQLAVGRRIWRGGDAEYLIDRETSRLRDVRDLFMGTGAGSSSYAIIEQGRVDQILQGNASTRRNVFDEAAGISRYKARKTEALRKLERVEQNLLRLSDIVDEVRTQLDSTRTQAAKAARFREAAEELRNLWLGLAADDHRRLSRKLAEIEAGIQGQQKRLQELNGQLGGLQEQLASLDVELAEVDDRLREAERASSANRETIAGHQATIRHERNRRRELEGELGRLRKQRRTLRARVREVEAEHEHNRAIVEQSENEFAARRQQLAEKERQAAELADQVAATRAALEETQRQIIETTRTVSDCGSRVNTARSQIEAAAADRQQIGRRLREIDEETARCRHECDDRRQRFDEAKQQRAAAEKAKQAIEDERRSLLGRHEELQRTLSGLRERRTSAEARRSVLQDLENRNEGFGIGVREILKRARTSDYPPWNRVLGTAADLMDVGLEQAALLDVAMGSRSQLIVIEEFTSLIDYLNSEACSISGRVGFITPDALPRTLGVSGEVPQPDLSQKPGVVGRADRFVKCSEKTPQLAENLLADTWIVETIHTALELASGEGRGCRFVTRQGEFLDSDGTLIVGTVSSESAIVSRKSELRALRQELSRLDRQIEDEQRRVAGIDGSIAAIDEKLQAAQAEYRRTAESQAARAAELAEWQQKLQQLQESRSRAEAERENADRRHSGCGDVVRRAEDALAAAEQQLHDLQERLEEGRREQAEREERLKALEAECDAQRLEMTRQEERVQSLRTSFGRLAGDLRQSRQQSGEAERRQKLAAARLRDAAIDILNNSALLNELQLEQERTAANAELLLQQKTEIRSRRARVQHQESQLRQQRRELDDAVHNEEIQARDLRHQVKTLHDRIEEEYQIHLSEVVESGVSAYQQYLAEREAESGKGSGEIGGAEDRGSKAEDRGSRSEDRGSANEDRSSILDPPSSDPPSSGVPSFEDVRDELQARVDRLRRRVKTMGNVDTDSLQDLDELQERYDRLSGQLADLQEARNTLEEIVRRINGETRRMFTETFESIRGHFRELFRKLFGGGEADVVLEDEQDVLECGVDIVARPPGKELRSISLLSGGEKTMTAVALLLAIFKSRPSPFCILDEVDAALDEANLGRFVDVLREFRESTQFIMITHRKPTMTVADVLYGVTMEQSGVSKQMTVRFEDVDENGNFRASVTDSASRPPREQGEMDAAA